MGHGSRAPVRREDAADGVYPAAMQTVELVVRNEHGIHARPAANFVRLTNRYRSKISIENLTRGSGPVNAKSILLLIPAGVEQGHRIRVTTEGPDEVEALAAIAEAVNSGLGEAVKDVPAS